MRGGYCEEGGQRLWHNNNTDFLKRRHVFRWKHVYLFNARGQRQTRAQHVRFSCYMNNDLLHRGDGDGNKSLPIKLLERFASALQFSLQASTCGAYISIISARLHWGLCSDCGSFHNIELKAEVDRPLLLLVQITAPLEAAPTSPPSVRPLLYV